ncbi:MAG: N-acyl-D-amino-acid deacylase family protein [Aestuariivirga sp.]
MAERCDILFKNAEVFDGTGSPPAKRDVAVSGERIVAVLPRGKTEAWRAGQSVDCRGLALSPGFIDAHTHDDRIVVDAPDMLPKISQGVTTVVIGNCGISLAPVIFNGDPPPPMNLLGGREAYEFPAFADYATSLRRTPPAVNVAALVGHSALRLRTMADIKRKANRAEIAAMLDHVDEAMSNGAAGFSTGLFYPTNAGADRDEVSQIASRFAQAGGVYATHMRDEFDRVLDSIEETLKTASDAKIPVVVSHHKCAGPGNWGRTKQTLPVLEAAASKQPVNLDVYPYTAGSTNLRADLVSGDYRIQITWSKPHPEVTGRDLADIAKEWDCDLHEAARRLDPAGAIYFQMHEDDVRRVMSSRLAMIGSDGLPHDKHPHPRLWGTFPRVIGRYARDIGLFPMETAIHKMTGLTARVFGLKDRGLVKEGAYADLVVFNPLTIVDRATYDSPLEPSAGIEQVYVNGRLSFQRGQGVVARAGLLVGGNNSA